MTVGIGAIAVAIARLCSPAVCAVTEEGIECNIHGAVHMKRLLLGGLMTLIQSANAPAAFHL